MFVLISLLVVFGITAVAFLGTWFFNRKTHYVQVSTVYSWKKYGLNLFEWLPSFRVYVMRGVATPCVYTVSLGWLWFSVSISLFPIKNIAASFNESFKQAAKILDEVKKTAEKTIKDVAKKTPVAKKNVAAKKTTSKK